MGIAGTSYAVSEYHITRLFAGKILGKAQEMTAGFGNFGGGGGNFISVVCFLFYKC